MTKENKLVITGNQTYRIEKRPFCNKKAGKYLKKQRKKKGLSVEEFAQKMEFTVPYVEMLERGRKQMSLETCIKICKVLKLQLMDFYPFMSEIEKKIIVDK
ncbi:hypothetical protein Aargi30884_15860 [Amedibacterium intestinale]|uniref:HTH cro/C1-type domain-containing protein n=1 Tax=Amedibacterium intestinale TaxID=2583452 RepID=A0A6N4TIS9_9FIRM|nr:helix-turn-helix transcriptional regulator [Amedibacterium intestinale]BBK22683.1 hypothetical protein Aargi30884_15860 [Amedibacterium intestinale]